MSEAERDGADKRRMWSDLGPRLGSAAVLLSITAAALIMGGIWFALLVGAVFAGAYREWEIMVTGREPTPTGFILIGLMAATAIVFPFFGYAGSLTVCFAGTVVAIVLPEAARFWRGLGFAFIGFVILAVLVLRGDGNAGIATGIFLTASVWMTDSAAFFSGRQFGGMKLLPEVSPSKTWSGALGGLAMGTIAGGIVWAFVSPSAWWIGVVIAACLSVVGQLGDLLESAVKRRFRVKDSSDLIPGHGGLLDRLDSLTAAAVVLASMGILRVGLDNVALGVLVW